MVPNCHLIITHTERRYRGCLQLRQTCRGSQLWHLLFETSGRLPGVSKSCLQDWDDNNSYRFALRVNEIIPKKYSIQDSAYSKHSNNCNCYDYWILFLHCVLNLCPISSTGFPSLRAGTLFYTFISLLSTPFHSRNPTFILEKYWVHSLFLTNICWID